MEKRRGSFGKERFGSWGSLLGWVGRGLFLLLFTGVALLLVWFGYLRYGPNLHQVTNGVYRSSQPLPETLPKIWAQLHFKTILNLRGAHPEEGWYRFERKFAAEHQIELIDFPLPDREEVPPSTLWRIFSILKGAPKPVLIHCKAGADRTGLVSAVWLAVEGNRSAGEMLSIKYGHFPYLGSKTSAMDRSFQLFLHSLPPKKP